MPKSHWFLASTHGTFNLIGFCNTHPNVQSQKDTYAQTTADCKTVRIFAYSSTREQSNKRSGARLKTESEHGRVRITRFPRLRLLRHSLPISLLILRKNQQFDIFLHNNSTKQLISEILGEIPWLTS